MSVIVQPGGVTAQVQGSRKRPYDVRIEVRTISPPDWERLQTAMAEQPHHRRQPAVGPHA